MSDQTIAIRDNPDADRTEIYLDDGLAGYLTYKRRSGLIAFIHTEIDPAFEGKGLGGKLAASVLDSAAGEGLAVLPFCPFISSFIEKHPEYIGLVPDDMRSKFGLPAAS